MPVYIYVQAKVAEPVRDPGDISFKHCVVVAANDQSAYDAGFQQLGAVREANETINDYVIPLNRILAETPRLIMEAQRNA